MINYKNHKLDLLHIQGNSMRFILKLLITTTLFLSISTISLNAREVSIEHKIAGLYTAFFNRAPDMSGLSYWTNRANTAKTNGQGASAVFKELSRGFATHPVFTSTYASLNNEAFVKAIYINSLGREGDSEGVIYWTRLLDNGMSRSDMVASFIEGSLTIDLTPQNFPNLTETELAAGQLRQDLITNKVTVAVDFVNKLGAKTNVVDANAPEDEPAYKASIEILSGVTEDTTTMDAAIEYLDSVKDEVDSIGKIVTKWHDIVNCAEVITYASNPTTGVCTQFSTPCDVPEGWDVCTPNQAPTANAGDDQTVTQGDTVTLSSSSTDSDGTITTYLWKEGTTTLSSASSFTKSNFSVGTHTITLTVTDNDGASATDSVVITVQSYNLPPEPISVIPINYLNSYRENAGMIQFTENNLLDQAALNHALYLANNNIFSHYESSSYPYFTGVTPSDRAHYVGYQAGVSENLTVGYDSFQTSIDGLITAIYHRLGFFSFTINKVGIGEGSASIKAHVFDMGNSYLEELCQGESFTGYGSYTYGICADTTFKIESSQYLVATEANLINNPKIVTWPYENQQDFQPVFFEESPDPLPMCGVSGNPISIQFNEYYAGDITMTSFKLFDANNNQITNVTVYDATSDINGELSDKEFALFPLDRLDWNTNYTAEFKYKEDGVNKIKSWIFKTKQIGYPYYTANQNEESFHVKSNTNYAIYLPPVNCNDDRMHYTLNTPAGLTINTREILDPNLLLFNISGTVGQSLKITDTNNGKIIHLIIDVADEAIR